MRALRIILGALIGLFAVIAAGAVAVLVLIGGAVGLLLSRLGLVRGRFNVNVQRGAGPSAGGGARATPTRVHAPDAIDVEATPVGSSPAERPALRHQEPPAR